MAEAARTGDESRVDADAHGCPSCPHMAQGPATSGAADVSINGKPALRVGDKGVHSSCCGPNRWIVVGGAPAVFVNGKPAARKGDSVDHCGGRGEIVGGSRDVFIGDVVQLPEGGEQETSAAAEMDETPT